MAKRKRLDRGEANAALAKLAARNAIDIDLLRSLPDDVDAELAAGLIVRTLGHHSAYVIGRCGELPVSVVRATLAAPATGALHRMVQLAIPLDTPDDRLPAGWRHAAEMISDLHLSYSWGSQQLRERFANLARDPVALAAIQGAVANSAEAPLAMLAVLVRDGSTQSYDALVPHITSDADRIDRLARLRTHAADTPALRALFAEVDDAQTARNAASPALALGPVIGVGVVELLWFDSFLWSREQTSSRVAAVQGHVMVDSRDATWFSVTMSRLGGGSSAFSSKGISRDGLGIGSCAPHELPRWLVAVARKLDISWDSDIDPRTHLRGRKRSQLKKWLWGGS